MIMMNECNNSVLTILLVWSGPQFLIVRCSCDGVQIKDLILPCIFSVKDHRRYKMWWKQKRLYMRSSMLLPNFCVFCHQLQYYLFYRMKKKNGMLLSRKQLKCVYNSAYHIMCCQSFSHLKMLSTCTFPIYPIKKHHWGPFFFFRQWV